MVSLENRINVFSIDGLNRCGKGTQTTLLKNHFKDKGYFCEILRGDGSRPGVGSEGFYDPYSDFWINLKRRLYPSTDEEFDFEVWNLAARKLNRENRHFIEEIVPKLLNERRGGVVLMDRSHLSRLFVLMQSDPHASFSQVASNEFVHPNHYFVLDVPKDELLVRNKDDSEGKLSFRQRVVRDHYETFYAMLDKLPKEVRQKVTRIDGTQKIDSIKYQLIDKIDVIIENG